VHRPHLLTPPPPPAPAPAAADDSSDDRACPEDRPAVLCEVDPCSYTSCVADTVCVPVNCGECTAVCEPITNGEPASVPPSAA